MFYKNGKCYNKIKSLGFTVGEVRSGTLADKEIKAILKSGRYTCNDPDAVSMFE